MPDMGDFGVYEYVADKRSAFNFEGGEDRA